MTRAVRHMTRAARAQGGHRAEGNSRSRQEPKFDQQRADLMLFWGRDGDTRRLRCRSSTGLNCWSGSCATRLICWRSSPLRDLRCVGLSIEWSLRCLARAVGKLNWRLYRVLSRGRRRSRILRWGLSHQRLQKPAQRQNQHSTNCASEHRVQMNSPQLC